MHADCAIGRPQTHRPRLAARRDTVSARPGIRATPHFSARARAGETGSGTAKLGQGFPMARKVRRLPDAIPVPKQCQGFQLAADLVGRAVYVSRLIDIFDAQQPLALLTTSLKKTAQSGDQRAEVKRPGGRGCETAYVPRSQLILLFADLIQHFAVIAKGCRGGALRAGECRSRSRMPRKSRSPHPRTRWLRQSCG